MLGSDIRSLAGVDKILSHFAELDVEVLRGLAQDAKRLVGRNPLPLDQDALRLADQLPGNQGSLEVLGATCLVFMSVRAADTATPPRAASRSPLALSTTPNAWRKRE